MTTKAEFCRALRIVGRPKGRQLKFLAAHYGAQERALNMRRLARSAGYASWRAVNLQYGLLAGRIASAIRAPVPSCAVTFLCDFIRPNQASNTEWILIMKPAFAAALKEVGWVS